MARSHHLAFSVLLVGLGIGRGAGGEAPADDSVPRAHGSREGRLLIAARPAGAGEAAGSLAHASRPSPDEDDLRPEPQPAAGLLPEQFFDDLVLGGAGEVGLRARLLAQLDRRLRDLDADFALTTAQAAKLRLAGRGDIKRLLDHISQERKEFLAARSDEVRLKKFLVDLSALNLRLTRSLFEADSLFAKTLRKLSEEQRLIRRQAVGVRRGARR